jgi:hypothetical protein
MDCYDWGSHCLCFSFDVQGVTVKVVETVLLKEIKIEISREEG